MYSIIVFAPLVGALIAGLFVRAIPARTAEIVTSGLMILAAVLSWVALVDVGFNDGGGRVQIMRWMASGTLSVDWALRIDTLTAVMLVVVNTVSALVHVYSIGYMAEDPHRGRFMAYLSLFTFAMLMLVTADNLVQMFFGWEGVGLASYLLIGFWYTRESANAAAMKAFIVNRVGDFGFALGIFGVFMLYGSVSFDAIFANAASAQGRTIAFLGSDWDALTIVCLLLFMGAMGKSAQVPLHTWLPDAMEGPTPVSALIHAATMVTAGVFMVARLSPLFELSQTALTVVTAVGAFTALYAATVGLVQNDIKRVIAYSTCSQLGYMFVALGVGAYSAGIFHLFTHAFFKALLFLGAGSVIHAMHHEQDMRNMGGLRRVIPLTYAMMVIGTLALTGFPFTAGYYSKDMIIEAAYASNNPAAGFAFLSVAFVAFLTAFYSWRLIFMTFHGQPRWAHAGGHGDDAALEAHGTAHGHAVSHDEHAHGVHQPHESPGVMTVPLMILAAGALLAGLVFAGSFIGEGYGEFWRGSLFTTESNHILEEAHHAPAWVVWEPFIAFLAGLGLAYWFYVRNPSIPEALRRQHDLAYRFLLNRWYFDDLQNMFVVRPMRALGRFFWQWGDGKAIDGLGPDGIAARVLDVTRGVMRLQTGYLYHYAFVMLIGVAALATWYMIQGAR